MRVSLPTGSFEPHLDLGDLPGRECRLAQSEGETYSRLPGDDAADFERLAARERLRESTAETWLEGEQAGGARRKLKQRVWPPPSADFLSEDLEGALWGGGYSQGD
ncbi:MAG: hypothetical protein ACREDV_06505 [Methylocella sp.]